MSFFSGGGGGGGGGFYVAPQPQKPTPAPPPPDRSDAEIQAEAARQRRKYGGYADASTAMATGGMGVPTSNIYSAVTALLGGGRA